MKRILFLLSFFYTLHLQAQEPDWYSINMPSDVVSSSNYKYEVDDQGFVYCINAFGTTLRVSQYDALSHTWNIISDENLTAPADKIKVDKHNGIIFFSFISEQTPTPLVNMYTIENGSVNLKFRKYNANYYAYSQYDFQVSGLDQYYWFMQHSNGTDYMLSSWNSGTGNIDSYIIPQFSGTYITNLQLEMLTDTLWFGGGSNPLQKFQLIKTQKDAVNFQTYNGSAQGFYVTGGGNALLANRTVMTGNGIDKLTLASVESNNTKVDITLTYGVPSSNPIAGLHFPLPSGCAKANNMDDHAYILGNYSPLGDSTNYRTMVLAKNYSANTWDTVGSPSTQFLRANAQYVHNPTLGHSPLSRRFVAAFDSISYDKQLRVLNALPDPDSTITISRPTLCTNPSSSPNSLFMKFSLWDPNHDMLEIVGVNSSNVSVISGADVSYTSGYFNGERVEFDIDYQNASLGTAVLDFYVTDGYDTIVVSHSVTFANYTLNSATDGTHCGPGQPSLSANVTNGLVNWYDSPTGGNYIGTGTSISTPYITSTTVYYAEGYDNNCVTPRLAANGIIYTLPTVSAGPDQVLCDGTSTTLSASGSSAFLTYSWDNGVTDGASFTPPAGFTSYTVVATDTTGCMSSDYVDVTVNSIPAVDAGFDQTICSGDNVILHGDGAVSYMWDNGVSDSIPFSPAVTSTYHVTGVDANGCMSMDSVIVTVNAVPVVSAGADQVICDGNGVTLSGSGADFYSWDNGATDGNMFYPSVTASYVVTGTSLNGCSATDTLLVTVNALPAIDAGPDQTVCENSSVTLNGAGGVSYSWDNGVTDGVAFTVTTFNTYTITGTDANGCQNTDAVDVFINGLPAVFAGMDQSLCQGDNIFLYGQGAAVYSWDNGISDSIPFTPVTTMTYHVMGTDVNGCVNTDSVVVTVNALPVVSGGADQAVCDGASITLSGSGADNYGWDHSVSDGLSFTPSATDIYVVTGYDVNGCFSTDSVLVTVQALPAVDAGADLSLCEGTALILSGSGASGYSWDNGITDGVSFIQPVGTVTYTLTGTDANGCLNTDQVDVTINALPSIDAGTDQSICDGTDLTLSGSGGVSYTWDNGVTDGVLFTPTVSMTYTVTGTDANGCSNTDAVDVTIMATPVISAGTDQTVCENADLILSGSGGITYVWDNGVTDGVVFNPSSTNLYAVTGYDINGCSANDTVLVTVNALPIVDAGADQTVCENTSVILSASGAVNYSWDNGVTDGVPFSAVITTTYTVTGTSSNGCQNTDQVDVIVNALPVVDAGLDQSACENTSFILNGSGANSYSWDNGVTDGVSFNPPAGVNTYTVTGTDGNGCENTDDITLTVFALPTINATPSFEICEEEEITLSASSSADIILWYNQSTGGTPIRNGSELNVSSLVTSSSFYVEAFQNGCTSARIPVSVTVNAKPIATLNSTNSNCGANNGSASAVISSGTAPYTYYWSSGEQQVLSVSSLGTGSYYFNVEDSKGCKALAVTEIIPTGISITPTITNPSCFGSTNGSITLNVSGISENLTYLWSTGHHSTNLTNMGAGTYEVTITGESGCVLTSTFTLTQPAAITNAVSEQRPTCGDNDGQLSVTATTGGTAPYFYSWSNGQTGMTNNNLTYGSYILTTSDQAGCQLQNTYYLSENGAPLIKGFVTETNCGSPTGAIDLDVTPGPGDAVSTISWSNAATTEDISDLSPGSYTCFLNTANNCTAINAWTVGISKPMTQEICIVTVDSVTTSNIVVWEKVQASGISHYNIYRETNQVDEYLLIDTVEFSNLSVFNDVVASPMTRSWRYRISAVDVCGVEGDLSEPNKTLHLNIFDMGASGVKVTWDQYEGNAFSNYILWRYTEANGWEDIATLGTSTLNYIDPTAVFNEAGLDYMVEISLDEACTATTWRAQDFNRSRSNKEKGFFRAGEGTGDYSNNGIVEFAQDNISVNVYPNPFDQTLTLDLQGTEKIDIQIFNIQNQLIQTLSCKNGVNSLELAELSTGVYYIQVNNKQESKIIRIVKN